MGKISFIVPVYNCEQFVTSCLNNIINSTINNYEIILVDDGSIDKSGKICDEYARKYDFIKILHQKNQGVSSARNNGLALATGDYVVFLDVDDKLEVDKLKKLLQILECDVNIDMAVFGLSFDYYYTGRCYRCDELIPAVSGKLEVSEWILKIPELYQSNSLSPIWNKVIKRSILIDNKLKFQKDMFLYEDMEFSLRCMACCETIYFCSDIIYHYRQSEDEGNVGRRLKRIDCLPVLIKQIELALDELIKKKQAKEFQIKIKSILLFLYLVLARAKIDVSNVREIQQICDDFALWFKDRDMEILPENQRFVEKLLNRQILGLIIDRIYVAVRHSIAVKVKNTGIYQKLRG